MTTSAHHGSDTRGRSPATTGIQKRVLAGGSVGQFIEFYDFTLYGLSAVTLAGLFFPGESQLASMLSTFATFGVAFFVRPLGGLFFGALGDRIGRRKVLATTLLTIGTATALIGVLPTYATIGAAAPALLVLCRLAQGFSAGGESVGAPAFVFEHAPLDRRGFWLCLTISATALPSVVGGTLLFVLSQLLSPEAFTSYGWRIPFLLALPLAFIGLWIRSRTEESPAFQQVLRNAERREHSPVREAFRENKVRMLQVVFVMGLTALGFYFLSGYFVSYLQDSGLSRESSLLANAVAMLLYAVLLPVGGLVGDRVGRKPMLVAGSLALVVLAVPSFSLVTSGSLGLALLGQALFVLGLTTYGGGCYAFFVEVFTTRTRFTSAAVSYNVAYAAFGGTAPFVGTYLVGTTGLAAAPGWYMGAAATVVLVLLVTTRVPETRQRVDVEVVR
ncbi:MFS transporter [Saccharopolyspora hordei]|uniref:Putative proline/betaine transporter n=1 Tax=Saccharopolyspora hordei TaxID=1838 RepID=A0A853APJ7_9PSEU|nr:MFS transporter [Saccharopolyspora hordei]NYI84443.1 MHS family proline/betaine transporter-like MFS transporter [Saccharopolyspora hordei]